jgi:hypothetical protein
MPIFALFGEPGHFCLDTFTPPHNEIRQTVSMAVFDLKISMPACRMAGAAEGSL